jgi:hypothetical protein
MQANAGQNGRLAGRSARAAIAQATTFLRETLHQTV